MPPSDGGLLNRIAGAAARLRPVQSLVKPWLPRTIGVEVARDFVMHVDPRDRAGPSFYLNFGGAAAFYRYEELEKAEILRALPDDGTFVDVGANIGLFSVHVARWCPGARVFAVEPHPVLAECLRRTRAASGLQALEVLEVCAGAAEGRLPLHVNSRDSGGHSLRLDQLGSGELERKIDVDVIRLDSLLETGRMKRLDALKVDAQGAEVEVLEGARASIAKFRPALLLELENREIEQAGSSIRKFIEGPGAAAQYRFRVAGEAGLQALTDLPARASIEARRGFFHTNYFLTARRD